MRTKQSAAIVAKVAAVETVRFKQQPWPAMRAEANVLPKAMNEATPHIDPDADLITAMADGDGEALKLLMDRHIKTLKALAWHMLGDEAAAEDVVQETFLKSWIQAEKWQSGKAKYITWMRRVATNMCLDRLRKKREILHGDEMPEPEDDGLLADAQMVEQDMSEHVKGAILTLPDRQRAAITLCHYQELSQAEAASILEISIEAYESLLSRGRRGLRKALADDKEQLLTGLGG